MRSESALVLFTLAPDVEGRRKSVPAAVVAALIERVREVSSALEGVDFLVATPSKPPAGVLEERQLPQRGRNFGESIRLAVEDAFALGYSRVVVVGNDAPEISTSYLATAFEELSRGVRRAVLGPAADGGYNLLGLSRPCPAAFESIPWRSSRVAETTERRLQECGFELVRLETLSDIDGPSALARFLRRAARADCASGLWKLMRGLRDVLRPRYEAGARPPARALFAPAASGLLRAPPC